MGMWGGMRVRGTEIAYLDMSVVTEQGSCIRTHMGRLEVLTDACL